MVARYLHIEQIIAIRIGNVVAYALVVISEHVQAPSIKDLMKLFDGLLGFGARDLGPDYGTFGFPAEWKSHLVGRGRGMATGRELANCGNYSRANRRRCSSRYGTQAAGVAAPKKSGGHIVCRTRDDAGVFV